MIEGFLQGMCNLLPKIKWKINNFLCIDFISAAAVLVSTVQAGVSSVWSVSWAAGSNSWAGLLWAVTHMNADSGATDKLDNQLEPSVNS